MSLFARQKFRCIVVHAGSTGELAMKSVVFDVGNVLLDWQPHVPFRKHFDGDEDIDHSVILVFSGVKVEFVMKFMYGILTLT